MGEKARRNSHRAKILNMLRNAGKKGVLNTEMSQVALRYGGTLGELYSRGYEIEKTNVGNGVYKYTLISEPKTEIVEHAKAKDILIDMVNSLGEIDGEELSWLLDELGFDVKRKANSYKRKGA